MGKKIRRKEVSGLIGGGFLIGGASIGFGAMGFPQGQAMLSNVSVMLPATGSIVGTKLVLDSLEELKPKRRRR